jgi:hypothetical protein
VPGNFFAFAAELVQIGQSIQRRPYASVMPLIKSLVTGLPSFGLYLWEYPKADRDRLRHFAFFALEHFPLHFDPDSFYVSGSAAHYELGKDKMVVLYDAAWRVEAWMGWKVFDPVEECKRAERDTELLRL